MADNTENDTLYKEGGVDHVRRIFPDDPVASVERPLFDSIAQEPARLSGTPIRFYSVRRAKARHPLYGEPSKGNEEWDYAGPWELFGTIDYSKPDAVNIEASSEGVQSTSDATMGIARKEFEDAGSPFPKVGDVIELWNNEPEFADVQREFFDVTKAEAGGNIHSTEVYVMWKLELKTKSRFDPSRKIEGERV